MYPGWYVYAYEAMICVRETSAGLKCIRCRRHPQLGTALVYGGDDEIAPVKKWKTMLQPSWDMSSKDLKLRFFLRSIYCRVLTVL